MDGAAPAVLNAVEQATGVAFDEIPLTPEMIMDALERAGTKATD
jgi:CO/xanthine dehydrogenase Mo-binding subunit